MRRLSAYLIEFCYWVAFLLLLGLAGVLVSLLTKALKLESLDVLIQLPVVVAIVAGILLILAVYFGLLIIRTRQQRKSITHVGTRGSIRISPGAVREFISRVLEEELGLSKCRIRLKAGSRAEAPLVVFVRTSLPLEQNVLEAGERIQELIKKRVEEHIGIPVERVEVFTSSIHGAVTTARRSYITSFAESDLTEEEFHE